MIHLSYAAIYILILTLIGSYYFVRYYLMIVWWNIIKYAVMCPIMIPIESVRDLFKYLKKLKRKSKAMTPTQVFIKIVVDSFRATILTLFLFMVFIFFATIFILAHLLFYWIFFVDHQSWIHWLIFGYVVWFFIRGMIVISILAIAFQHFKKFPKVKYFKELRHVLFMGFSYVYLAVVLVTFGEVLRLAAEGIIQTPFYMYYVHWFHLIF